MPETDGELIETSGRNALRFERRLRQPPERVWRAMTDSADLAAWHPSPFTGELAVGAPLSFASEWIADGVVTHYDPIERIGYRWGAEGDLLWELAAADDGGTVITLTHTFDERRTAARYGAGWTVCLVRLAALTDGTPDDIGEHLGDGWQAMNDAYEAKFGIGPGDATPVPDAAAARR